MVGQIEIEAWENFQEKLLDIEGKQVGVGKVFALEFIFLFWTLGFLISIALMLLLLYMMVVSLVNFEFFDFLELMFVFFFGLLAPPLCFIYSFRFSGPVFSLWRGYHRASWALNIYAGLARRLFWLWVLLLIVQSLRLLILELQHKTRMGELLTELVLFMRPLVNLPVLKDINILIVLYVAAPLVTLAALAWRRSCAVRAGLTKFGR